MKIGFSNLRNSFLYLHQVWRWSFMQTKNSSPKETEMNLWRFRGTQNRPVQYWSRYRTTHDTCHALTTADGWRTYTSNIETWLPHRAPDQLPIKLQNTRRSLTYLSGEVHHKIVDRTGVAEANFIAGGQANCGAVDATVVDESALQSKRLGFLPA